MLIFYDTQFIDRLSLSSPLDKHLTFKLIHGDWGSWPRFPSIRDIHQHQGSFLAAQPLSLHRSRITLREIPGRSSRLPTNGSGGKNRLCDELPGASFAPIIFPSTRSPDHMFFISVALYYRADGRSFSPSPIN